MREKQHLIVLDGKASIKNLLKSLISDKVDARRVNRAGANEKIAVRMTRAINFVRQAVGSKCTSNATINDIDVTIASWLAHAPERVRRAADAAN